MSEGQESCDNSGNILRDTILAEYHNQPGDSGGIVYLLHEDMNNSLGTHCSSADGSEVVCKVKNTMNALNVVPYYTKTLRIHLITDLKLRI